MAPIQHTAHSAAVPWTTKLRVNRPCARAIAPARRSASSVAVSRWAASHAGPGRGDQRPRWVHTCPPVSPTRAACST
jgi:hypothetical protein